MYAMYNLHEHFLILRAEIHKSFPDKEKSLSSEQLPKGIELGLGVAHFGGELKPKNVKGIFDKLVVRAMRKEITEHDFEDATFKGVLPEILPENIKNFAIKVIDALYN